LLATSLNPEKTGEYNENDLDMLTLWAIQISSFRRNVESWFLQVESGFSFTGPIMRGKGQSNL